MNATTSRELVEIAQRAAPDLGHDSTPEDSIDDLYDTLEPVQTYMSIENISADVRIVRYASTVCFDGKDDILIERQVDGQWTRVRAFNSFSNDYAHTQSRTEAHQLADQIRRGG